MTTRRNLAHQIVGWGAAALVATFVLGKLREASWAWTVVAALAVVMLAMNAAAHLLSLMAFSNGVPGGWVWRAPQMIGVVGTAVLVLALLLAVWNDRRRALSRDWLHTGGIIAIAALALVHIANNLYGLW
ncbi:MAG: hypothetical protein WD872_19375 [Pirellulaceae bacterium]